MIDERTMVRTTVALGENLYLLAQGQDLGALQRSIVDAVREGGAFVDFVVVGNRAVSVLMTAHRSVVFTIETVPYDERDTGDVAEPFGGFYDLI
jgi:hypothetical protein